MNPPTGPITILVCVNRRFGHATPSCAARGSEAIADALEVATAGSAVSVTRLKCFGRCAEGPNVRIRGGRFFRGVTLEDVDAVMEAVRGAR